MEKFMLLTPDLGKERWKMVRNLSECFFGTRPIGDTWKFLKGGCEKGPATRPSETSLCKLAVTISGWAKAVGKFREKRDMRCPEKPMSAP